MDWEMSLEKWCGKICLMQGYYKPSLFVKKKKEIKEMQYLQSTVKWGTFFACIINYSWI